jgi:hypothetical protein
MENKRKKAQSRWRSMIMRCENIRHVKYPSYGGRGITVCERWHDFDLFYADVGDAPPGMTLDRRDNDDGYHPGNWRWATAKEQIANRRPRTKPHNHAKSRILDAEGREMTVAAVSKLIGCERQTLRFRLQRLRKRGIFVVKLADLKARSDEARRIWLEKTIVT